MRRTSLWSLLCGLGVMALTSGQPARADEPEPVVLGALYNLSGSQASLDRPSAAGARVAVEEVNAAGGVLGRPVQLLVEDGESDPAIIERTTAELLARSPSLAALIGLSDTDMVLAAAPVAAQHRRLFLTSGATSPRLPAQVPEYLFLACFGDNVQAAAGAEWAYQELGTRTVSILLDPRKSYTRLLERYFRTRFEELGGEVVSREAYTPDDLAGPVGRLGQADLVFLSAAPEEALAAVLELRKAGFSGPILGGDGLDEDVWAKHPEIAEVYFTTHAYLGADNPDPKVVAFRAAYQRAHPGRAPDAFAALGYDTARLVMAAVARAGSAEPGAVLQALAGIRRFDGVTGTLSYAAGSRIPTKSVTILEVAGGARRLVEVVTPERVPAP